jgi:hypothetical protein
LLFRTVLYWFFLLAATSLIMLCVSAVREPGATLAEYYQRFLTRHGIVAFATLILLPFVLYDVLATSNRFAGPLYRMRQAMRDLASGVRIEPIQFRERDFWRDVADEFNALAVYVEELKQRKCLDTADRGDPRELQAVNLQ